MIRTKKKCKVEGCTYPVFGHGYCLNHYKTLFLLPKEMQKLNKKRYQRINKISKKQERRIETYVLKKEAKKELLIKQKQWCCLFTGKKFPIRGPMPSFHHLLGRDGDHMTDIDLIWPVYDDAHRQYHDFDYERIIKLDWYEGFINRLEKINKECYRLEIRKKEKALQVVRKI